MAPPFKQTVEVKFDPEAVTLLRRIANSLERSDIPQLEMDPAIRYEVYDAMANSGIGLSNAERNVIIAAIERQGIIFVKKPA